MKTKYFHTLGIIQGKPKDHKLLQEYMKSTINTIKSEIEDNFSKISKYVYVYYKYNQTKRIFNIFVVVFKNEKYKYIKKDITYLIKVTEEYPENPPKVFCLSNFHYILDIFDMKNLQKNLVEHWNQKNTVNDLIHELLKFADSIVFQAENRLFPVLGEYNYNSYIYDLNDFLINKNNVFFRAYYFSSNENINDLNKNEKYMIVTKNTILFFANKSQNLKNHCIMEFKFELAWIDSLKDYSLNRYPTFKFFEFVWNNHSNYYNKFVFGIREQKNMEKKIYDIILDRKLFLMNNFKYFEKFNDNDVETLEKIINIKEQYLEIHFVNNLFYQINKLYRKIIDIFNSMNDEGYKKYIEKLQNFLSKYEKVKKKFIV